MAGNKAVSYAEDALGVHAVFEAAQQHEEEAGLLRLRIADLRRVKAAGESAYLDAEYDFISDLRGANKDMSQTAFDKLSKMEVHRDPNLRLLRADLAEQARGIERCEANLATLKLRCEIAVARLHELGGYLAYLAAVKNAEVFKKGAADNWPPDPGRTTV